METISPNNLLKAFILQFTPVVQYKGKYNHNEFTFVHSTISKIFLHHTGTPITPLHLAASLTSTGHIFYVREGESGLPSDPILLSKRKKATKHPFFDFPENAFVYVSVSSNTIFQLKKSLHSIAYYRNPVKIAEALLLKKK